MPNMIIIDGNSLLFRAYYATAYPGANIMRTTDGTPTNAIFSFSNMILKIIGEMPANTHLLVAFDAGKDTLRKQEMDSYKANRQPAPEDLVTQFPLAREFLRRLGIFTFELNGYEGDDIAGTAARLAEKNGFDVLIYTSDRDFLQLVDDKVTVRILRKGLSETEDMTPEAVVKKYGFPPDAVRDFKGLCGDASDNIPGVPGIGEKTATKLIIEYGSLEKALENAPNMKNKIGQKLLENAEQGLFCKRMATIMTDVPLPFTIADTLYQGYDLVAIREFAEKLQLNQFLRRLPTSLVKASDNLDSAKKRQIKSSKDFFALTKFPQRIGLAIKYNGKNYHQGIIETITFIDENNIYNFDKTDFKVEKFKQYLADGSIGKDVFDSKATKVVLQNNHLEFNGVVSDLMLAAYLLDSSLPNQPAAILNYFQRPVPSLDEDLNIALGEAAFDLATSIREQLAADSALDLYENIELPLAQTLANMEIEGFPLDAKTLSAIGDDFRKEAILREKSIYELAGEEFNISSPQQVAHILFDKLHLPANRKKSTSIDQLKKLLSLHPIIGQIIEYRKYSKLISTYIDSLIGYIDSDGKIHATFNQAETTTGRLSSSEPNLQNISIRDEEGKTIRKAFFYPDERYELLSFDYSQIELRILAALSGCNKLIDAFKKGDDIHKLTAQHVFHKQEINSEERRRAKAVNFGIVYGISDWGLSEQLNISPKEAARIINDFYAAYPEIAAFLKKIVADGEKNGYVSTMLGRRRYLRELHDSSYQRREFAKRAAMNAPIQGTAADLIKIAMIHIDNLLKEKNFETSMILQIHDELLFKVPIWEKESVYPLIREAMEKAFDLSVPLKVEGHFGRTWYDAK